MKTCMVCHILLRRTTADRGQALPRRSGAPGRHRPGGRGADRYHEVGGSRLECRERVCEADDQKAPLKTTSPPLSPAAVSPILPMIGASGCSCIFGGTGIQIALPREGLRPSRDVRSHDGFTTCQLKTSHIMPFGQPEQRRAVWITARTLWPGGTGGTSTQSFTFSSCRLRVMGRRVCRVGRYA